MKSFPLAGILLCIVAIGTLFNSCKKCHPEKIEPSPVKTIKSIRINNGQTEKNLIFKYDQDGHISYVGPSDLQNGYTYKYRGSKISHIEHRVDRYTYEIDLINSLFLIKKAEDIHFSTPLTPSKVGDLTILSTNANELAYLELQIRDGNLVKAHTNAFYLKTSLNFQYNDTVGQVYGNSIPVIQLKNPLNPTAAVWINELISLALQAYSQKQLISFHSVYSSARLNYTQHAGAISSIHCRVEELDPDGVLKKTTETDLTYTYSN
ncbi:MAG: hypothetical protein ACQUHE_11180 [Bacteroidia bacterium]